MNSILVPVISNLYIKKNIFNEQGLVDEIFYLAITNTVVPPILQFVNIGHIVNRTMAWFRGRPWQKIKMEQEELSRVMELREL